MSGADSGGAGTPRPTAGGAPAPGPAGAPAPAPAPGPAGAAAAERTVARDRATLAGAAAAGFLLAELLRAWLPTLVVVLAGSGTGAPTTLVAVAFGTLALAPLAGAVLGPVPPRLVWLLGATLLLGARLGLLLVAGGTPQVSVTTVGVAGGVLAVAGLAGGAVRGDVARLGLLAGAALSAAVLAVLGSVDLVWRGGVVGVLGTVAVIVVAGPPLLRATRALDGGPSAAAWPWGTVGPALLLLAALVAPSGRVAVATGWAPGRTAVTTVGVLLLTVVGGLLAARTGPLLAGTAGAALVLTGAAAAIDAAGVAAVVGQGVLAVGLGLGVVTGSRGGRTSARRRGVVAGGSLVTFGVLTFAAYAGPLLPLPFGTSTVLLTSAAAVAVAVLVSTLRGARIGREPSPPLLTRVAAVTVATALLLAAPASLRAVPAVDAPAADGTLRLVLANVHFGFDVDGRQRALELADLLADLDADLVALNEVDRGWFVSGTPDLLTTMAVGTGLDTVFGPAADEVWGNGLLTRLPVVEVERIPLPQGRDPMARAALAVVVEQVDGAPLGLVVTHLSNVDRQGDTRLPQAQTVAAAVARLAERGVPTLVAGDLNATPGAPAVQVLEELGLRRALPPGVDTFPDRAARAQIDHVLVPAGWDVVATDVLATGLSDHRVVVVDLARRPVTTAEEDTPAQDGAG